MPPTTIARAFAIAVSLTAASAPAANLLINGDFNQGATSFTSDYTLGTDLTGETRYAVGTNPRLLHPAALSFGDHTTGAGPMLLLNGALSPNIVAWRQTIPVLPHSSYDFAAYACSWGSDGTGNDQSPAVLTLLINGQPIGASLSVPKLDALYTPWTATWNSADATAATLEIIDTNTAAAGNDFILDDLSFTGPIPEPTPLVLTPLLLLLLRTTGRALSPV